VFSLYKKTYNKFYSVEMFYIFKKKSSATSLVDSVNNLNFMVCMFTMSGLFFVLLVVVLRILYLH
jgi:hypothetical protein